jgi:hypothetical protein
MPASAPAVLFQTSNHQQHRVHVRIAVPAGLDEPDYGRRLVQRRQQPAPASLRGAVDTSGLARPIHFSLASVVLSINHAPGDRNLSISVGSNVAILVIAGFILWVLADLLVERIRADAENRQFV